MRGKIYRTVEKLQDPQVRKMFNQMVLDAFELINDAPVDKGFTALHHIDVQMHPTTLCEWLRRYRNRYSE